MRELKFAIVFHGPFRVATGLAGRGLDVTVDCDQLIPASSLKGVMRAAAAQVLSEKVAGVAINKVFGTEGGQASPWSWGGVEIDEHHVRKRARVAIDETTGAADDQKLLFAEDVWAEGGRFVIRQQLHLPDTDRVWHETVLAASAYGVHALGGDRRRGLGWVSISCSDLPAGRVCSRGAGSV